MGIKRKQIVIAVFCLISLFLAACGKQTDTAAYVEQGMEALAAGDFAGAKTALTEAQKLSPDEPRILRSWGIVFYQEEDYPQAITYFSEALSALGERGEEEEEKSVREDILRYKAEAEAKAGNYENAEADYDLLISLDDEYVEHYLLRGKIRAELGNIAGAAEDFRTVLAMTPGNLEYCEDMYLTLAEKGELETGMEFLDVILSSDPQTEEEKSRYAAACLEKSIFQIKNRLYDQALSTVRKGISMATEPVLKELRYEEAVCHEQLRDFKTALECFVAYRDIYGTEEAVEHEIAFLKTRVNVTEFVVEPEAAGTPREHTDTASHGEPAEVAVEGNGPEAGDDTEPGNEDEGL